MLGDEKQAERHLNSAFRRSSVAALYCVNVIELQALSPAYYTPTKDYVSVRIHYSRQLRRKDEGGNQMKEIRRTIALFFVLGLTGVAQVPPEFPLCFRRRGPHLAGVLTLSRHD